MTLFFIYELVFCAMLKLPIKLSKGNFKRVSNQIDFSNVDLFAIMSREIQLIL